MDKNDIISRFKIWVELKTNKPFPITNDLLLLCLEEAVQESYNTADGKSLIDKLSETEFMEWVAVQWKSNSTLLFVSEPIVERHIWKGLIIPVKKDRERLLSQLDLLISQCVSET